MPLRAVTPNPTRSPWHLGGLGVRELGQRVWRKAYEDEVLGRAASLSYYFLFALFPTLLFLTALLGLLPVPDLMTTLMTYAASVLPGDTASLVARTLDEILRGASRGLLSLGALAAWWAASSGTASIATALNMAHRSADTRPWWLRRLTALFLTLVLSIFTLTALLLLVFGPRIGEMLARWVGLGPVFTLLWTVLHWPAAALLGLSGITLLYTLAPAVRPPWSLVTPGSLFAVLAWLGMSFALRTYVAYVQDYNATYGSIGGVILLMLWLYLSGVALLVGAEINVVIDRGGADGRPDA
jgi:membrane protein